MGQRIPTQPVCVVFTDIIDSTNGWDTSQAVMWEAVQAHHKIVRTELRRFGGYESKSIGDGFFVSFSSVRPALHFSVAVQNKLAQHQWHEAIVHAQAEKDRAFDHNHPTARGLIIRMGLHWGKPHASLIDPVSKRTDFYGTFVNEANRIQAEADGDEIAVSDAFLVELHRVQTRGEILDPKFLSDEFRARILFREISIANFQVHSKGERFLKGLATPEYITLIGLRR